MIVGLVCGPLGVWIVLLRQSYAAESIAHGMLPGLVAAALLGVPLVLGAGAGVVVAAGLVALVARDERIGGDTAVAVVITTLFGAGALLALEPHSPARLAELLFGNVLGVKGSDLIVAGTLGGVVLGGLSLCHRRLSLVGFDRAFAPLLGWSAARTEQILLVLLALTVAVSVQALGALLVVALVIAPAAAALRLGSRLGRAIAISAALAVLAGVIGLYVSHYLELAAGASIALTAIAVYLVVIALSARARSASSKRSGRSRAGAPARSGPAGSPGT